MRHAVHAICAIAALGTAALHAQAVPGLTMKMRLSVDSAGGLASNTTLSMETAGDRMRMWFNGAGGSPLEGIYVLYDGSAGTMSTVLPASRQVTVTRMEDLAGGMMPIMKMALKGDAAIDVADRGAGDAILGRATHRYHLSVAYTVTLKLGDVSCDRVVTQDEDIWSSADVTLSDGLHRAFRNALGGSFSMLDALKVNTMLHEKIPGLWLRSSGTTTTRLASGSTETVKGSAELTELAAAPIDPARLVPPKDFQILDIAAMMANIDPALMAGAVSDATRAKLCGASTGTN